MSVERILERIDYEALHKMLWKHWRSNGRRLDEAAISYVTSTYLNESFITIPAKQIAEILIDLGLLRESKYPPFPLWEILKKPEIKRLTE